jgi:hypothetical protein
MRATLWHTCLRKHKRLPPRNIGVKDAPGIADLYSILGVSEDDVDASIRYSITYIRREGILDVSEAWVHRPIIERFRGYTHQNAVCLQRIAVDWDDCIVFELQLVNPDVAIQEIVDEMHAMLCELLPWPQAREADHLWREIRIATIGDPEAAEKDLVAYLEAVRRSKPEDKP